MGLSLLTSSCIAAVVTRLMLHPLDTLRVKSQLNRAMHLRDAYSGIGTALLFSVPGLSTYLLTYDYSKQIISNHSQSEIATHGIAAVMAEVASGVIW